MTLATQFWTITPAGNGILYSGYPAGNPPAPTWTAVPNYLNQTQSFIVDIPLTFVTPSSASVTLNGSLPTGWTWTGADLEYNGTSVNASPTTGLYFTATYLGLSSNSNTFSVQGQGVVSSDTIAPTIPTALALTANSVGGGITIGGFTPADPNPVGQTATGLGQINILRNSSSLGTATIPSPGAPGNLTTLTLTDLGGPFSPASSMTYSGADITLTTVAVDPAYPTTDGQAFPYQQISGTSWVAWCKVSSFSPANPYDNVNIQARPTLTDNAAYVGVGTHSFSGGIGFFSEARAAIAGNVGQIQGVASSASPGWLFLVRNADTYSMYYSLNGNTLLSLGSTTQIMGSSLYVGFPVNTNDGVSVTVTIQQCTIQTLSNWSYTDSSPLSGTNTYSATSQDSVPNVSAASTISVTTATANTVKFNSGHYAMSNSVIYPNTLSGFLANAQSEIDSAFAGAGNLVIGYMTIVTWAVLETTQNNYGGMSILDQIYSYILSNHPGKHFAVMVWGEDFFTTNPSNCLPGYITTSATYGAGYNGTQYGYWQLGTYGCTCAMWRGSVIGRIEALFAALASRASPNASYTYDTDPLFEAVTWQESSLDLYTTPSDYPGLGGAQTQWQNLMASMVASFPHTSVIDQQNYWYQGSPASSVAVTNADSAARAASGSPDTYYPQSGFTWGQLAWLGSTSGSTRWVGKVPNICFVEYPDYGLTSMANIFTSAATTLQSSHIFWEMGSASFTWAQILTFINANPIPASPNGTYPSLY